MRKKVQETVPQANRRWLIKSRNVPRLQSGYAYLS